MGNCLSSSPSSAAAARSHAKLIDSGKAAFLDATERDASTATDLDVTLPLSPLSPAAMWSTNHSGHRKKKDKKGKGRDASPPPTQLPSLSISPVSFPPLLQQQQQHPKTSIARSAYYSSSSPPRPDLVAAASSSSLSLYTASPSSHNNHTLSNSPRRNRALRARLEKARSVQRALSHPPFLHSAASATSSASSVISSASTSTSSPPNRSLVVAPTDDFDATFHASTIYASLDYDSSVTALALGPPNVSSASTAVTAATPWNPTPPLLVVVGTANGTVSLTGLRAETPASSPTSCAPPSPHSRGGGGGGVGQGPTTAPPASETVVLGQSKGNRTVRAVALDASHTYVAAGGDDCRCRIWRLTWKESATIGSIQELDNDENDDAETDETSDDTSSGPGREKNGGVVGRDSWTSRLVSAVLVSDVARVDRVYATRFSTRGTHLAVGGFDGTVAVLARKTGGASNKGDADDDWQLVAEICRDGLVYGLDWSFDSRYLAIAGTDKTVALVDTQKSWQVWKEVKTGLPVAQAVQFRPKSYSFAVAGSELVVVKDWTVKHSISLPSHEVTATPDSSKPGSTNDKSNNSSHPKHCKITDLCWSPTGTYLVLIDSENICRLLETTGYSVVHELRRVQRLNSVVWGEQPPSAALCSPGGIPRRFIFVGSDGPQSQVVVLKAGLEFHSSAYSVGGDDFSFSAASSIASSIHSASPSSWVLKENVFRDVEDIQDLSSSRIVVDKEHVMAVCFSRGSRARSSTFLAYSLDDGRVVVRSTLGEWQVVAELLFSKPIKCLEFSLGSRYLALGSAESRVHVVETAPSWTVVAKHDFFAPINAVGFSKRNERLAVGVADGILALFDPQDDYAAVGDIDVSDSAVLSLDWSAKNFAIGRVDGTISIYDASQVCANFCVPLAEHELCSPVHDVAFGPNSRFVAAGARNGLVNVYSAKGGWVLCHQVRGPSGLSSMCWNSSGRILALGGEEGLVKMVDTIFWADVEELEDLALAENTDSLRTVSSMAFDQSGVMFAFVAPDGDGIRVVDTNKWRIVFSHRGEAGENAEDSSITSL